MAYTVLLYGATGYSGRLIAAEARRVWNEEGGDCELVLAGRDASALEQLADECGMDFRVFALDDRSDVARGLRNVDVLINAAGPFAWTAERLAKAALDAQCHYVDINGEVDVYRKLDDLARFAELRKVALVCGAGYTGAMSDLLLNAALERLDQQRWPDTEQFGAIRIAISRIEDLSGGSVQTVWRSMREQVTIVRQRVSSDGRGATPREQLMLYHEPVGKLERTFDFAKPRLDITTGRDSAAGARDLRIASAANLVDTLIARLTLLRRARSASRIESYVETNTAVRMGYQVGGLLVPFVSNPWMKALVRTQIGLLPDGPRPEELRKRRHVLLLEIEDMFKSRIVDWRWETPNSYEMTARIVLAVAECLAGSTRSGWLTPADALSALQLELPNPAGIIRGCDLYVRSY